MASSSPRLWRLMGAAGEWLARPIGWFVLLAVLAGTLGYASLQHSAGGAVARVSYLESVIKCPPCSGLSIAQSDVAQSKTLRNSVTKWVAQGWTNERIEAEVVSLYGADEILRPSNPVIWIAPIAVLLAAALLLSLVIARRARSSEQGLEEQDEQIVRAALEELGQR